MHYLITGGAGFIGSHLTEALLHAGHAVTVFDSLRSGKLENLAAVRDDPQLTIVQGDVRDLDATCRVAEGKDGVFHFAALVSVPTSIESPQLSFDINVGGSQHVLEAARRAGARRVVLASSAAVYGDNPDLPLDESARPTPLSPYGAHKRLMEELGETYHTVFGLDVVVLRFFNVYGHRQDATSPYSGVISLFLRQLLNDEPVTIYGDGQQTRDFIYVADVVATLERAMAQPGPLFRVYNVGSGVETRVAELAALLQALTGSGAPVVHAPARTGDIVRSCADAQAIARELGVCPAHALRDGLSRLVALERQGAAAAGGRAFGARAR